MPACSRIGDTVATGHLCTGTAPIQGAINSKVIADNSLVAVSGDAITPHTIKVGKACVVHGATVGATTLKVTVMGIPACRIGDPGDAGGIISGTGKVMIGG